MNSIKKKLHKAIFMQFYYFSEAELEARLEAVAERDRVNFAR